MQMSALGRSPRHEQDSAGPRAAAVEIAGLHHHYTTREALKGIDLTIGEGEIFGLLGPNGGGKSTLFRILSTLLLPSEGTARICGLDVAADPHGVRSRICVVFQSPSLDGRLSVVENLRHQGHLYGLRGRGLEERIAESLARLGLAERARERVERLSGGQQRRVEIAKALLHRPRVLLLDEPTTGLDPGVRLEIWDTLSELRREERLTILLSTHLLEEAERCDRVAILHRGQIFALGAPAALRAGIGADVLVLRGPEPERLAEEVRRRTGIEPQHVDGALRIEHPHGAELLVELLGQVPDCIEAISLGKPTLEDVFLHHTGLTLQEGDAVHPEADAGPGRPAAAEAAPGPSQRHAPEPSRCP
jgi:ABC-2 type transport system ATP-binding protein